MTIILSICSHYNYNHVNISNDVKITWIKIAIELKSSYDSNLEFEDFKYFIE